MRHGLPWGGCDAIRIASARGRADALAASWGTVLEVWEGFATDASMRRDGSSGGLSTALAMFCVERLGMAGVLHIGNDEQVGYRSKTQFSQTRDELLAATGSRYAPASPCERLDLIENATAPCVFLGKPCDVEALRKAADLRERLRDKIGVAIGIFCAGTPSTAGTLDLIRTPRDCPGGRRRGPISWSRLAGKLCGAPAEREPLEGSRDVRGGVGIPATISALSVPPLSGRHQRVRGHLVRRSLVSGDRARGAWPVARARADGARDARSFGVPSRPDM